jgi:exonuclease III
MKTLSWNCQGLGNPRTVRELCRLVKEKKPDLVFLMETKLNNKKLETIRVKLGFQNAFGVDSVGKSGGLALFWQGATRLEIQNYSRRHINAIICPDEGVNWRITGFYGHQDVNKREEAWSLLRFLAKSRPEAWVILGDFNEIVEASEKQGGGRISRWQMEAFQRVISDCEVTDLGYKGLKYTWTNCQDAHSFVRERLDRALANKEWCLRFPTAKVSTEVVVCSDHNLLFLSTCKASSRQQKKRGFIYDATWSKEIACKNLIKKVWKEKGKLVDTWENIKGKMDECKKVLTQWKKDYVGVMERTINEKTKLLQDIQDQEGAPDVTLLQKTKNELSVLKNQEDLIWRQRAKEDWLQYGDKNTKFFHASTKQRRNKNILEKIKDEEGRSWTSQEDIGTIFVDYYRQLFKSEGSHEVSQCTRAVTSRVSEEGNKYLLAEFTGEEISKAVHQMAPFKPQVRMVLRRISFKKIGQWWERRFAILFFLF